MISFKLPRLRSEGQRKQPTFESAVKSTRRLSPTVFNIYHFCEPHEQAVKGSVLTYEVDVLTQRLDSIIGVVRTPIWEEGVFDKTSTDRSRYRISSFESGRGLYGVMYVMDTTEDAMCAPTLRSRRTTVDCSPDIFTFLKHLGS